MTPGEAEARAQIIFALIQTLSGFRLAYVPSMTREQLLALQIEAGELVDEIGKRLAQMERVARLTKP